MFRPFRTTEPKFFNILRLLSAIIFIFGLCFYTWISVADFTSNIYKPNLVISKPIQSDRNYHVGFTYPGTCFKYSRI
jgi:hypothetical protein